jgi:hypothetical protein
MEIAKNTKVTTKKIMSIMECHDPRKRELCSAFVYEPDAPPAAQLDEQVPRETRLARDKVAAPRRVVRDGLACT